MAEVHEDSTAMVVLQRRELFEVRSLGLINAQERAAQVSAEILALAQSHDSRPEDLRLVRDDRFKATGIVSGRRYVTAFFDHEAEVLDTTTAALATERHEIIRQAVIEYRSDYSDDPGQERPHRRAGHCALRGDSPGHRHSLATFRGVVAAPAREHDAVQGPQGRSPGERRSGRRQARPLRPCPMADLGLPERLSIWEKRVDRSS